MDRASGSGPGAPRAREHLNWDVEKTETVSCTLATARLGAGEVVLNFGKRQRRGDGPEIGPELARAMTLSPLTAHNLAATLRRLIDENDGAIR